ncbi:MAG: cob(I)yrinic acid a,c-diamide adenosyltransferase [Chloroflexota bacterium]
MWRGDHGLTDLIDRKDLSKSDLRFEVLGTLDEASSALGIVRAGSATAETKAFILAVQRDLCWMMSEFAAETDDARPSGHISAERVQWLEAIFNDLTQRHPLGEGFVAPGDTVTGAALQLARTIVRRAERHVIRFHNETPLHNSHVIPYLNHLSAVLYALARTEDVAAGVSQPTPAKPSSNGHHPQES